MRVCPARSPYKDVRDLPDMVADSGEDAEVDSGTHQPRAARKTELDGEPALVGLDGLDAQRSHLSYFGVGVSETNQLEHFGLPLTQ